MTGAIQGIALRRQRGQALVFVTVTAVIVLLTTLAMFNVGSLSYHRIKLQNTADAVSYSAAISTARDLNFTAYMNRGVIANQVQVAQIVSMTGWLRNIDEAYNGKLSKIHTILANMSALGSMYTVPMNIVKQAGKAAKEGFDPVAGPAVKILDKLILALGVASQGYHVAVFASIPASVVPGVLEANEPEAKITDIVGNAALLVSTGSNLAFAKQFTPATPADGDNRMANVTEASTDYFYRNRSLPPIWPLPFLFDPTRLVTYGLAPFLMINFHSGGGTLKTASAEADNLQGWSSLDATGLFVIMMLTIPVLGIPVPIPIPLPLPISGGAAVAGSSAWDSSQALMPDNNFGHRNSDNTGPDNAARVPYGLAHFNPMTAIPAWIKVAEGPGTNLDASAGIRPYLDLKDNATNSDSNQATTAASNNFRNNRAPAWVIEIERPSTTLLTSTTGGTYMIGGGSDGQLDLSNKMNKGNLRALSKAEAYFSRPKALFARTDGRTEWGSLYSPYWQARLQPNSLGEQGASIAASLF